MGAVIQLASARTLPLTRRQEQLWRFIKSCRRSPSFEEMAVAMGTGRGNISRMILSLKEKGFVNYLPARARSIVALDPGEDLSHFRTAALVGELERRGVVVA